VVKVIVIIAFVIELQILIVSITVLIIYWHALIT